MSQITTLTFFKYPSLKSKVWAFIMMPIARYPLARTKGLNFYKLMGSGKAGFNPAPDWSTYGLLQIWDREEAANEFFNSSQLFQKYKRNSLEQYTIYMKSIDAKGEWSGKNPFEKSETLNDSIRFIAVITRATIKFKMLRTFWKYVPTSQEPLKNNDGLLFTMGIGEVPLTQMATFSIWKNKEALMDFAHKSKEHAQAIVKTRKLKWYKEELFSRFQPYKTLGLWGGKDILEKNNL
jgi:heme-degrading monooxygenase HmoA